MIGRSLRTGGAAPSRSLYVHTPFCERKCAYCDFASREGKPGEEETWIGRIEAELRLRGAEADGPMDSVFIGGGTPSALSEPALARLCRAVADNFRQAPGFEWSVEANPASLTAAKLAILREHGVGRVSMGVQSFVPRLLETMGRAHDDRDAAEALDLVAGSGLRWNADLIFALPGQSVGEFQGSLERLLAWEPSHVSFYGLSWEPGTPFRKALDEGRMAEATDDDWEAMYQGGVDRLAAAGIHRYEVSNFARPGEECRHNEAYWKTDSVWLAAGNAAHGYRPWTRWRNPRGLSAWSAWADRGFPAAETEPEVLSLDERWTEEWFLGLRTARGVDLDDLSVRYAFVPPEERIERRIASGQLVREGNVLRLHGPGWMLLDAIAAELSTTDRA